ncbi:AraC family transcriptional regulator [Phenylobacterium montanum]|uniref:AraC family transcriptional regulator n=1 Tax=Phenylobacterium montanum TaxID=2823693 RepID=A0A975IV16_9CAUL|nr:AraC family transcriptional regulator [Caulobacter sp. S6]QUD88094.1 AraC family transcriptional regulator [Caulobacter sp. S6]
MAEPTVGAGYARALLDLATNRGADRAVLLERAGIDSRLLEDQDSRLPFARFAALMRVAKALTGDPALALRFGETIDLSDFSIVGLIANASETMQHALTQLNRYGRLVVEVDGVGEADRFQHQMIAGQLWMTDTRKNPNDFPELTESTFARMATHTRRFGDTPFVLEVHVTHPEPAYRAEYDRIFRAPVVFEADRNALRIDPAWIGYRIQLQPRYAFGVLSRHAEALLESLESSNSVRARVESRLMPILHTGEVSMELIARDLGMSRQTLFRRLKAEGVTFEKLLDDLRRRLALHYLNGRRASVNEVAYLVGFSDPAAFSRAFKRWTGASPRAARSAGSGG